MKYVSLFEVSLQYSSSLSLNSWITILFFWYFISTMGSRSVKKYSNFSLRVIYSSSEPLNMLSATRLMNSKNSTKVSR